MDAAFSFISLIVFGGIIIFYYNLCHLIINKDFYKLNGILLLFSSSLILLPLALLYISYILICQNFLYSIYLLL